MLTGVGKCPFLGILNITFKYMLAIISPKVGWCSIGTFANPWLNQHFAWNAGSTAVDQSIPHLPTNAKNSLKPPAPMSQDMMQWKKHVKKDIAGNISDWWMLTAQFVVISFFYSKTRGHQINPRNCQFYSRDSIVCLNSLHVSWCFTFFFPG